MNREQYAEMLRTISEVHKAGGDIRKCIMGFREKYKYAYIYNDSIFKMLFGNPENMRMTASLLKFPSFLRVIMLRTKVFWLSGLGLLTDLTTRLH